MTSADPGSAHLIVVGLDGSPSSLAALDWAARQAHMTRSLLEAVITWQWPSSYGWALTVPGDYVPAADARKVLDQALEPIRGAYPDVTVHPTVIEGHAAPTLVEASRRADLLVVGSRGHGEFAGMLLGSVGEHCATNAHCPVVVWRDGE